MAAKAPFVSSLGNVLSAGASAPSTAPSSAIPSSSSSFFSSSSSIQWPQSNGATRNPFASFSAAPSAVGAGGINAGKSSMMSAFSGLGLALNADGGVVSTSSAMMGGLSAAQQLIAAKSAEKAQEDRMDAERTAKRDAIKKQQEAVRNAPRPVTALSQALGAFDTEISQSDMLTRKSSSSATLSRRARQKKDKARERAEGYDGKRTAKSSRDTKRSQRKEKYKHVY